ncbi:COPII coat Sec23p-Sfb3p heterodimer component [Thoreauomyces humboldtii]|nr:COPII coat Sec23p-Sfb3p heterodimer component [Thoreauomyces humboldtii]
MATPPSSFSAGGPPPPGQGQQQASRPRPPLRQQQSVPAMSQQRPFSPQGALPNSPAMFRPQRPPAPGVGPAALGRPPGQGQTHTAAPSAASIGNDSSQSFRPPATQPGQRPGIAGPAPVKAQAPGLPLTPGHTPGHAPGQPFAPQHAPLQKQESFRQPGQPGQPQSLSPAPGQFQRAGPAPLGAGLFSPGSLLDRQTSQPNMFPAQIQTSQSMSALPNVTSPPIQPPQQQQQMPAPSPSNLAADMSAMHIGPGAAPKNTRAKRVYAPTQTSTGNLYAAPGAQPVPSPTGVQPHYGQPGPVMGQSGLPAQPYQAPAYGQPQGGFAQPPLGSQQSSGALPNLNMAQPTYQQPNTYQQHAGQPGIQQPGVQAGMQHPGFSQPQPGFQQPQGGFQPPQPGFQPQHPTQQSGYQQPYQGYQQSGPLPHGQGYGGGGPPQKSRIDPNQVPSAVAVQEADQSLYDNAPFSTTSRSVPPLASTTFKAVDDGNCSPRFIRLTAYNIPCTDELVNVTSVPLGMIIQPLAELAPDEEPIELVDMGEKGPIRCHRCKAYVNAYFHFIDGGRKFVCNLCHFENEVPAEYFMNLDMSGRRMDLMRRPELRKGTIDFVAPKGYCARPPKPVSYVIAIDVTWNSVQSGLLKRVVEAIRELLYNGVKTIPPNTRVGIITFDKSVHFYNLSPGLEQPQMLVVSDVSDMFVPLNAGFLVDPMESRAVIETLLDTLPTIFENNRIHEPALGAAVQAAHAALKEHGGKVSVFQTALPTFGPGMLKNREDAKMFGTDKERTLYEPQEYFWPKLGQDCASDGVSIDMFLFPSAYIDVATVGSLSALTGGELYLYPNFDTARDGLRVAKDFINSLTKTYGFDALLRIRVSNGLKVTDHFGNFYMKNVTDVEIAGLDSSKAIGVGFKHDGKLDEKHESAFQAALLYTTSSGERRIRVHNISVPNTTLLGNVFRFADMDTTINYLSKAAVAQTVSTTLKQVRERLTEKCVKILAAYRKHAASSTSPGQLILPESYKLFALYLLCILKLKAFRGGPDMPTDIRVLHMRMLKSFGVPESVPFLYPRLMQLHDLVSPYGEIDERGLVKLPPLIRVSAERLSPQGAYVIENGQQMIVYLGRGLSEMFLKDVFGVPTLEGVDPKLKMLPVFDNPTSQRIRMIVSRLQQERSRYLHFQVVRQQMDQFGDVEFNNLLIEDQNMDNLGYVEYLVTVHR